MAMDAVVPPVNVDAFVDAEPAPASVITPAAPPWLWVWAAFFIVNLPPLYDQWRASFHQIDQIRDSSAALRQVDPGYGRLNFLLYPAVLLDVLASGALLLGLVVVVLPHLRARYVQRRFRLAPLPASIPVVAEIEVFVRRQAPNLQITGNLARSNALAFVYPLDYRNSAVAVFGGFVRLWVTDRTAAEAVLLHEIAHYRRGDTRIVGIGSFFETVLKYAIPAYLLLFLLPTLVLFIDQLRQSNDALSNLGMPASDFWSYQFGLAKIQTPKIIASALAYFFWNASFFIMPLAAIWSAEFTADRVATDAQGRNDGVLRALTVTEGRPSWWRQILFRLSHPPLRLRRWMIDERYASAIFLLPLIYPIAYIVRLFVRHGWAIAEYFIIDFSWGDIWHESVDNTVWYLRSMPNYWLVMAGVLLLWPLLARSWEHLMAGTPGVTALKDLPAFLAGGVLLVVCALVGFVI